MNPDKVASIRAALKEVLEETRRLNQGFVVPESSAIQSEIFGNQHALVSMLKLDLLQLEKELGEVEAKVQRLKHSL
jgi:hypothetical protein